MLKAWTVTPMNSVNSVNSSKRGFSRHQQEGI
jgi:hypothetical protein